MEPSVMSDPEISVQFKLNVKGADAVRAIRRPIWVALLAALLTAVIIIAPRIGFY
jgi:hypothetical protein